MKIKLESPYGYMTTPSGTRIENGAVGTVHDFSDKMVVFERFPGIPVNVPAHWRVTLPDDTTGVRSTEQGK